MDLFDEIAADLAIGLESAGTEMVGQIKESISVSVGRPATHAAPGEPPRRDTGLLHDSIASEVQAGSSTATLIVSSDCSYAVFLENSHPFFMPVFEQWVDPIQDRLIDIVSNPN